MRASDLAKAVHDLIRERGDVDIATLDPFSEITDNSDWTGDFTLISQPFGDKIIGMIVARPNSFRMDEDLAKDTIVHAPYDKETVN